MTEVPVLNISLGNTPVGTIAQLPGGNNVFSFDEAYINNQNRPTLSLSFKDIMGGLITDVKPTQTRLPPFFSNLLPEGQMREYLANRANIKPEHEFYLLWMLGGDLPGAIQAIPAKDSLPPQAVLQHPKGTKTSTESPFRFSLAGVQLKFSAASHKKGGLTISSDGAGGAWIIKLPDAHFEHVPENEFAMMSLAKNIGIEVPDIQLSTIEAIHGLPEGFDRLGKYAFVIKRFDRKDKQRIHFEDFAQIFNVYAEKKYDKANYRNLATVIWSETGEQGITEFIKRLTFTILVGNGDMHLKNWALIYPNGVKAQLAPAFDFVSTIPYIQNERLALNFIKTKDFGAITLDEFKRFAAKSHLPEKLVLDTVTQTSTLFREHWHKSNEFKIPNKIKSIIDKHLQLVAF